MYVKEAIAKENQLDTLESRLEALRTENARLIA